MATWKGIRPTKYSEDMGIDWAKTEVGWEYQTTSDILTLTYLQDEYADYDKSHPQREFQELMSPYKALAILEQLADWCNQYQGPEQLDKIINKIRERN